jgi:excisionase family DNA binding protein
VVRAISPPFFVVWTNKIHTRPKWARFLFKEKTQMQRLKDVAAEPLNISPREYEGRTKGLKPLRSIQQAAELLNLSPWTIRAYIREGRLRPVRLGRRVLLTESELERLIAEGQEQADGLDNPNAAPEVTR